MNCSCVKRGMHASHLGRCFCWDGLGWLRCFFTVRFCKLFFFVLIFFLSWSPYQYRSITLERLISLTYNLINFDYDAA